MARFMICYSAIYWAVVALATTGLHAAEPSVATAKSAATPGGKWHVYIGTYTGKNNNSQGIYRLELDADAGTLKSAGLAAEITNPSFLAIHPSGKYLYAVGEVGNFAGGKGGAVSALAIDPQSGKLELLNQRSSVGSGPCHVSVDPSGKCVLAANYGGGNVVSLPIGSDGQLGEAASVIQHEGSSVNPGRQKEPHAHSINIDAQGKFAFAADLGIDKVLIYKLDAAEGKITPNDPASVKLAPGAGPRHFAFHPVGKFAFVNNELNSTVTAFAYDAAKGALTEVNTASTLPTDFKGNNGTAEIQVHPSGKFVYVSNRGHDSIAVFTVDDATGKLAPAGHVSTGGKTPRNFSVHPGGKFLLAANQNSGTVVLFTIDPTTGMPKETDQKVEIGSPVCVKFLRMQ